MQNVIVMGGSFNPPTLAHGIVLSSAVEQTDAKAGVFVPSSDAYVRKKMNRRKPPEETLSERIRYEMLETICEDNPDLFVSRCEFGDDGRGHTYETLSKIQETFPDDRIWFLVGADKLKIIPRWRNAEPLLSRFGLAVLARKGDDPEKMIASNEFLSSHSSSFRFLSEPEGISEISSTRARELVRNGDFEEAKKMMSLRILELTKREFAKAKE